MYNININIYIYIYILSMYSMLYFGAGFQKNFVHTEKHTLDVKYTAGSYKKHNLANITLLENKHYLSQVSLMWPASKASCALAMMSTLSFALICFLSCWPWGCSVILDRRWGTSAPGISKRTWWYFREAILSRTTSTMSSGCEGGADGHAVTAHWRCPTCLRLRTSNLGDNKQKSNKYTSI